SKRGCGLYSMISGDEYGRAGSRYPRQEGYVGDGTIRRLKRGFRQWSDRIFPRKVPFLRRHVGKDVFTFFSVWERILSQEAT
ncbi:MAG: hypothetical protein AAB654_01645, partial [Acidobacteriota bacterium]